MPTLIVTAVLLCLLAPRPAAAQIYAWRDANGTLVLSDRAVDAPADLHVVEGAPTIRTTRAAAPEAGRPYERFILEYSERAALRPELVRAVIQVESAYNPRARSPKGAMGLMQLMPATARELGVVDAYDPEQNISGGTRYLRMLLDRYGGDERLALAAYNAGAGAVDRHGGTVPPYRETREYVRKVGRAADRGPGAASRPLTIYKFIEIVDNRLIPKYSTSRPVAGTFEIVRY